MTRAQIVLKITQMVDAAKKATDPEVKRLLLEYVRALRHRLTRMANG